MQQQQDSGSTFEVFVVKYSSGTLMLQPIILLAVY